MKIVTYDYQKGKFETVDDDYTSIGGQLIGFGKHTLPNGQYEKTIFEIYLENSKGVKRLDLEQGFTLLFLLNDLMSIDNLKGELDLNIKKGDAGYSIQTVFDGARTKKFKEWIDFGFPEKSEENKKARMKLMFEICTKYGDALIQKLPYEISPDESPF
jgi:hypothetical protein